MKTKKSNLFECEFFQSLPIKYFVLFRAFVLHAKEQILTILKKLNHITFVIRLITVNCWCHVCHEQQTLLTHASIKIHFGIRFCLCKKVKNVERVGEYVFSFSFRFQFHASSKQHLQIAFYATFVIVNSSKLKFTMYEKKKKTHERKKEKKTPAHVNSV